MKKNIIRLALSMLTVIGMTVPGAMADCLPSAATGYQVPFMMVTQQNYLSGNPFVSFTNGVLYITDSHSLFFNSTNYATSATPQLFSDRYVPCSGSGFCFATQPFDLGQPTQLGVSITRSNSILLGGSNGISVTLKASSMATQTFSATCDATTNMLVGDFGGNTHVSISLGTPFILQ